MLIIHLMCRERMHKYLASYETSILKVLGPVVPDLIYRLNPLKAECEFLV